MSDVITLQPHRPNIEDEEAIHPALVKSTENLKDNKEISVGSILCAIITCPCKCCNACCDLCEDICAEDQRRRAYYNRNESIFQDTFPTTDNNITFLSSAIDNEDTNHYNERHEDIPMNNDSGCIGFESYGESDGPNQCDVVCSDSACDASGGACDTSGDACD